MTEPKPIPEIDVAGLVEQRKAATPTYLIDVREGWEHALGIIDGAHLLALSAMPHNLTSLALPKDARLVTYCHHGMRSLKAASLMREAGFTDVTSLAGGIDAWAQQVAPNLRRY